MVRYLCPTSMSSGELEHTLGRLRHVHITTTAPNIVPSMKTMTNKTLAETTAMVTELLSEELGPGREDY